MARKVNYRNINKLLTSLVILISIVSFSYFVYLSSMSDSVSRNFVENIGTCSTIDRENCVRIWQKYLSDFRTAQLWSGVIGIGLPIIFFGGKVLLNYIAPEIPEEKKVKHGK